MVHFDEYGNISNPTIVLLHCAAIVDVFFYQLSLSDRYHMIVPHLYGRGKEVSEDYDF